MACIRDKASLLRPRLFHREERLPRQKKADEKERSQRHKAGAERNKDQVAHAGAFMAGIGKRDFWAVRRILPQKAQRHLLQGARFHAFLQHLRHRAVNGAVGHGHAVAANDLRHAAIRIQQNRKRRDMPGRTHAVQRFAQQRLAALIACTQRHCLPERLLGLAPQHMMVHRAHGDKHRQQHHGHQKHIAQHKFPPQLLNHVSPPSSL